LSSFTFADMLRLHGVRRIGFHMHIDNVVISSLQLFGAVFVVFGEPFWRVRVKRENRPGVARQPRLARPAQPLVGLRQAKAWLFRLAPFSHDGRGLGKRAVPPAPIRKG
jgi:hypothetical protein